MELFYFEMRLTKLRIHMFMFFNEMCPALDTLSLFIFQLTQAISFSNKQTNENCFQLKMGFCARDVIDATLHFRFRLQIRKSETIICTQILMDRGFNLITKNHN